MPPTLALLIPIIAIVGGLSIPIAAIFLDFFKRRKIVELHHKERLAAIDKGMEVPPLPAEYFQEGGRRSRRPANYLLRGLVWFFIGAGIFIALYVNEEPRVATYGLIPLGIGLAYLLYYVVEGKKVMAEARLTEAKLAEAKLAEVNLSKSV